MIQESILLIIIYHILVLFYCYYLLFYFTLNYSFLFLLFFNVYNSVHIYKLKHWLWHCCDGELECHNTPQWTGIIDYHIKDVHTDQITSIHFAPLIETIMTSSLDGTCTVISYERRKVKKVFKDHKNAPYDVIWCDSKRVYIYCKFSFIFYSYLYIFSV